MTGIDVEDNAVVNNVVEVLCEVVAPKTRRSCTLNGLNTTTLHPTNVQQAHIGVQHCLCTKPFETLLSQLGL